MTFRSRAKPVALCELCQLIPFETLRCPTLSDIQAIRKNDQTTYEHWFPQLVPQDDHRHKTLSLGLLGSIKARRETCGMCNLIWKILSQRGPFTEEGRSMSGLEISVQAENTFYGVFYPPEEADRDRFRIVCRLSLITNEQGKVQDSEDLHKQYLQYCFQACSPGSTQADVSVDFLDTRPGVEPTIFGGRRRPLTVDCGWLRQWLRLCEVDHGAVCNSTKDSARGMGAEAVADLIRFIDVQEMAIRSFKHVYLGDMKYIALSYVWGTNQKLTLRKGNLTALGDVGTLRDRPASRTIMDAIDLTRQLGLRYIWVDALCIIQDDDIDKKTQLRSMGAIYGCASATVVAAAGESAESGLPGLRPGTRWFEQAEVPVLEAKEGKPAMSLMTTINPVNGMFPVHYLDETRWNTRGWTFQERYLSRRVITFTAEQVYFSCNTTTFCEESYMEHGPPTLFPFHSAAMELSLEVARHQTEPQDAHERFWRRYRLAVQRFTRRHFTFAGDVYDAFEGLLQEMTRVFGVQWLWGLPRSRLNDALAWSTRSGQVRRSAKSTLPMTELDKQVEFPSWSWMGWIGEAWVSVTNEHLDEINEAATIDVYVHANEDTGVAIRAVNPTVPATDGDDRVQLQDVKTELPSLSQNALARTPGGHILLFWAERAVLSIARKTAQPSDTKFADKYEYEIRNSSGTPIGTMGPMIRQRSEETRYDCGTWEFIQIRRRQILHFEAILTVLQIERQGDLAYRINIGEIQELAWQQAGPERVLIALA
ncbi:HET-domain-containing protein [Rhizodiscina lignyota]|uniref:HET-domain-containing protein n=1 Tax=Rhizodiscina lignyota TaxID=1504668 RepID=A0A9P4M7U0_9PEZI|nr:HET-domain-containing protein [Rhizodiscina lignyota]